MSTVADLPALLFPGQGSETPDMRASARPTTSARPGGAH